VDHGAPSSFLQVDPGIDVISSDGQRVGKLEHVLTDDGTSIFDGIVIDVATGPGGHRFVDAPAIKTARSRNSEWPRMSTGCPSPPRIPRSCSTAAPRTPRAS